MKVSTSWLKELVNLSVDIKEVIELLPHRTIGTKEVTDKFFELDMKGYNRADLLSMRGVGYEVSAITSSKINFTEDKNFIWTKQNLPKAKVKVENPELVPLYCIAKIEGLKVSKSPDDWVSKLSDCGMRSINNIADITNLIMLEYGQPMHAFDNGKITDDILVVRTAKKDEEIKTLDGKVRQLEQLDLLIADSEKAVGIAGVMGGKNSEVTDDTTAILLEAAIFDPGNLRTTAKRLNLPSEASRRFQHGLTKKRLLQALNAAIKMYQDLGGRLTAISIIGDIKDEPKILKLDKQNLDALIGTEIPVEYIEKYLTQLNFKLASQGPALQGWEVTTPYYRLDIEIEADLIEEVARMYGYEKIAPQELKGELPATIDQTLFNSIYDLKEVLAKAGLIEIQTYSFYRTDVLDFMNIDKSALIKIVNPISAETEYMRDKLWPNLVETVAKNLKRGLKEVTIFEIGKVYLSVTGQLPTELYKLSIAMSDDTNNTIQKLWSVFQSMTKLFPGLELSQTAAPNDFFHPVRFAKLIKNKTEVGKIAEVHPRIIDKFGVKQKIAVLEVDIFSLF